MTSSEQLVREYRRKASLSLAAVCRWVALLLFVIGMLNYTGIFVIRGSWIYPSLFVSVIICFLPSLLFNVLHCNKRWASYAVLTAIVFMCGAMYTVVSYHCIMMIVFPLVCACLYSERKVVIYTVAVSVPVIILSHLAAYRLKIVPDEPLVTLHGVVFYGILPRLIQFLAIGIICISITGKLNDLINTLIHKNDELYEDQQALITSLSQLIDARSQETGYHIKRVSEYTRILCTGMNCSPEEIWKVSTASMMHDVGKLLVPTEIIEKPDQLTGEEFEQMKLHVDYGRRMLEKSPGEIMQLSAVIAYQHHEKWDGSGYKHLKGDEINPYARCVAVADVFDALVSVRTYKPAWTTRQAYEEILKQSGHQFDPAVVEVFQKTFDQFEAIFRQYPESWEADSVEDLLTARP